MRRLIILACFAMIAAAVGTVPAAAQEATPVGGFGDLGLPELTINITASAFEGIPDQLEAGRYLVTVTVAAELEEGSGLGFIQPSGMSAQEFLDAISGAPQGTPMTGEAGTAVANLEGSPAAGGGETGAPPPFVYQATFAGGTYLPGGQTAQVVLDLGPGEWIAWGDDPAAPQQPVIFEATGEMPADLPEPASTATATMAEYVINISEGALQTGPQIVKIENVGAQPHFIFMAKGPDGMTAEQVQVALDEEAAASASGTPPAYSDLNPDEDIQPVVSTGTQSMGTTQWITLDLEPGTYVLLCFFPDISDGQPHAWHGMFSVVDVA